MLFKKKRTKYDAPAPRQGECDIDLNKIWNKKSVSKDLTPRIKKILGENRDVKELADNRRG